MCCVAVNMARLGYTDDYVVPLGVNVLNFYWQKKSIFQMTVIFIVSFWSKFSYFYKKYNKTFSRDIVKWDNKEANLHNFFQGAGVLK